MGKLNTNQSMMLWESIGILQHNVKEFDMPQVFGKMLHISQNKRRCLHSYMDSTDQCSIKVQRTRKLFRRQWYFSSSELLRKVRWKLHLPHARWCHAVTQLQPQREAWQHYPHPPLLQDEPPHCPRLLTDPRNSSDPSAGHSCPEKTDFCFHKYKWPTVAPCLLADGKFILLPSKEADILFPKYQGRNRLHKESLIYFFLYYELFSSTIAAQMRKEGKEGPLWYVAAIKCCQ